MPHEKEVKIQVTDLGELAARVRRAGGGHIGIFLQTDRFYDTPDGALRLRGSALRIRTEQRLDLAAAAPNRSARSAQTAPVAPAAPAAPLAPAAPAAPVAAGGPVAPGDAAPRPLITFKGPRQPGGRLKVRLELQTRLDDVEAMAGILDACGLRQVLTVQKRRQSYRLGRCQVELDELPLLGCFVEIEGPDEQAIYAVKEALGIEGQPILESYLQLLGNCCADGRSCGGYTFEKCSACPNRPAAARPAGR